MKYEEYIKKNGMPGMVRVSLGAYNYRKGSKYIFRNHRIYMQKVLVNNIFFI